MSDIDETVRALAWEASKPAVEQIEKDVLEALKGRPTAEAVVALTRVVSKVFMLLEPAQRGHLMLKFTTSVIARLTEAEKTEK